jgi:outer membrane lipoprotein-sorting protein
MFKYLISFVVIFSSFASSFHESEDFKNLESQLLKVKTIKGDLVQDFRGERVNANFALSLPSKLKVEYTSPEVPLTIIVTPSLITYYDKKLDQKSQIKTPKNASSLLLTSKLSLNDPKIKIKSFKGSFKGVEIEFSHSQIPESQFKIFFIKDGESFNLNKIELENGIEKITTEFNNIVINADIKEKEFQILNKKVDTKLDY